MGDIFNAMKDEDKERRHERKEKANSMDFSDFIKHTDWHWSRMVQAGRIDYWPTKNKWRMNGKNYFGTPQDLKNFVEKRRVDSDQTYNQEPEG